MYNAFITRINKITPHLNADKLKVAEVFGNFVCVGLDMQEGQKVIYFPCDGRLSEEYCEQNNLIGTTDSEGKRIGGFFNHKRKVECIKLRGFPSDGYIAPIESLAYTGVDLESLKEGTMFTEINGHPICEKYVTAATRRTNQSNNENKKGRRTLKETISYPNFFEHKDTENIMYCMKELKIGDVLHISAKLHGSSFRVSHSLVEKKSKFTNFINGLFKREIIKPKRYYDYVFGTRRVVIKNKQKYQGYYGKEDFRDSVHKEFIGKLFKGECVYGEIVGWVGPETPIMSRVSNEKVGKDFVKQYGKETIFTYNCLPGQCDFYVYRMSVVSEDGIETDYTTDQVKRRCMEMNVKYVPEYTTIIYDGDQEKFTKLLDSLAIGPDPIDSKHIKEGVVIRRESSKWKAWKHKSVEFKILSGTLKNDDNAVDIEENEVGE